MLLGSGISRAAEIPTAKDIVIDLIRKLAKACNEDCEPDPIQYYRNKYSDNPSYSKLLSDLSATSSERNKLLKQYFEPSEEERELGKKMPTKAHNAVAELISNGYFRVIVTTNFDRLLERAVEAVGQTPIVISSPDSAEGALPLAHSPCTIIKVNGDYLDTRFKNTPEELAEYDKRIDTILDRIFDDYGLIICGWSAEWDEALYSAILRCKSRRYTTYFTLKGQLTENASQLIKARQAKPIEIENADRFFQDLLEKVQSIEEYSKPHPLSANIAVASEKRYLTDDRSKIRLHDLIMQETERVYSGITSKDFSFDVKFTDQELIRRVKQYESITEILQALLITGTYWSSNSQAYLWEQSIERIANIDTKRGGLVTWFSLALYPALFLIYGCGIACLIGEKYNILYDMLTKVTVKDYHEKIPVALYVYPTKVMNREEGNLLFEPKMNYYVPVSEHLFQVLREPLREIAPDDAKYENYFDRFEYFFGLIQADQRVRQGKPVEGSIGRLGWKAHYSREQTVIKEIEDESSELKDSWPPLKAGLFDGSFERFQSIKTAFDEFIVKYGTYGY